RNERSAPRIGIRRSVRRSSGTSDSFRRTRSAQPLRSSSRVLVTDSSQLLRQLAALGLQLADSRVALRYLRSKLSTAQLARMVEQYGQCSLSVSHCLCLPEN